MSEALSTSPASAPRPLPTWEATIAPLALPSIAMRGPASCFISSGIAWPRAWVAEPAIGSTSTFQTGIVSTIHSARDHAAVVVTPEGNSVVVSSQWSARRTASATAPDWAGLTVGSGSWAAARRARSVTVSQLTGPSCGAKKDCICAISELRSGRPPPGAEPAHLGEDLLEGRALEGVVVVGTLTGRSGTTGGVTHGVHGTHRAQQRHP